MVPLYFVNQYWQNYRLVRIGLSGLPLRRHWELGRCIREAIEAVGRKAVLIASGDLSHRLKADGPQYDARIMDVMGKADFSGLTDFSEEFCAKAGECGHRSFTVLAGVLEGQAVKAERLSYEGPFGVGYGICSYEISEK